MYIIEKDLLRKNNNFDLLRHIAAFFVFISHTYGIRGRGNYEFLSLLTGKRYLFSHLGLAIFFSMSGFLVCRSLVTASSTKQYLLNRFLRIWPAYAVCILFCLCCVGFPFTSLPLIKFITHPQTLSFFFINLSLLSSYLLLPGLSNNQVVNPSIWTIPVEVRLYLLLLVTRLVTKLRFSQGLLILLISVWVVRLSIPEALQKEIFKSYVLTSIDLALYFLTGSCFYLFKEKIAMKFYIWLLLLIYWLSLHIFFPSLVHKAEQPFWVYSFMWIAFRWPVVPFIKSDISYGFYLYSSPVQMLIQATLGQYLNFISFLVITGCCSIIMALLSWHLIEKKALSLKKNFKNKPATTF